ncbi:unnamed protein product [Lupinus luteus]|uniref:F-box domain-containing protein n=1 Tax=Lupinus luteus TaxID=3873 RepID=A0AAV1YKZ9_LUPLU
METVDHAQLPLSGILVNELVIEILSRLPVKSLLKFRCVSKSWKSLISHNPQFVKLHLHNSPKNANLILFINKGLDEEEEDFDIRAIYCSKQSLLDNSISSIVDAEDGRCFEVNDTNWSVGSCNGLVCFRSHFVNNEVIESRFRFWNPALRLTSKKSPPLYVNKLPGDPFSPARYGFGYDSSSDTFKVVVMILGLENTIVKVHSMGDSCWKEILSFPTFPVGELDGQFLNGTLNWLAVRKSGYGYNWRTVTVNHLVIFSLDLEKETYRQLSLPAGLVEVACVESNLKVLSGCLSFFFHYRETHFVMWQMKEFGVENSWTPLVIISDQHLQFDIDHPLIPLCTSENGNVIVMARTGDFGAIIYNCRSKRVELIETNFEFLENGEDYVESLVCPG